MNALQEYNQLPSIKAKLSFSADGRPGVATIRKDQQRLSNKKDNLHRKIKTQLGSSVRFNCFSRPKSRVEYYQSRHNERYYKYIDKMESLAIVENDKRDGSPRSMLGLSLYAQKPNNFGPWFYTVNTFEDKDYHYYSKAWHRRYGPKVTVSHSITFARMFRGKPKLLKKIIEKRGDYAVNAAVDLGILKPVKSKVPLKIRLKNVYDAKQIATKRGYKIYERTLCKEHVDYVIVSPMGVVYHDSKRSNLIKGLHAKIRASAKAMSIHGYIDWKACKKLGFCDAGIKAFCDDFGLSTKQSYSPAQIEQAVRANPNLASPYLAELKTLANAYHYPVNI